MFVRCQIILKSAGIENDWHAYMKQMNWDFIFSFQLSKYFLLETSYEPTHALRKSGFELFRIFFPASCLLAATCIMVCTSFKKSGRKRKYYCTLHYPITLFQPDTFVIVGKISVWYLSYSHIFHPLLFLLKCVVFKGSFLLFIWFVCKCLCMCCMSCWGNKIIGNKGQIPI